MTVIGRVAALAVGLSVSAGTALAQTTAPPFDKRLDQTRTVLQVDGDGLHGPGAAVIADAVGQARYVLIGEDHLSREIPRFATGICRLMAPGGLQAFAVETGPEAVKIVNDNLRRPDRAARIAAFALAHPDGMAFQNGRDESDMAARCARLAGPRFRMWGLDQEFFGATGYLLDRMLAARPGPRARSAIDRLRALDRTTTAAAVASGSVADFFIYKVTDPQMAAARIAIAQDGGNRAGVLFDALAETRAIYLGQNGDGVASNGRRARLMKRTLVRYLAAVPHPARVLFKFGDAHMGKGTNGLGQRDLGNFVAERAEGEGASSLHVAVYGARGVHALYGGVGRQVRHEPFVMSESPEYSWSAQALASRDQAHADHEWMLVDLRALRSGPPTDMPAAWRKLVQSYDLLVIAPELTPSELLGAHKG